MPYEKNKHYTHMAFCSESNRNEFYTYFDVEELAAKCEMYKEGFKCRTIGLFKSINGNFFISSIKLPLNETKIRVSLLYMKKSPKSTLTPYTVQLFGSLQWRKQPVIFAHMLQAVNTSMAIRLKETLGSVTGMHLARVAIEYNDGADSETSANN